MQREAPSTGTHTVYLHFSGGVVPEELKHSQEGDRAGQRRAGRGQAHVQLSTAGRPEMDPA